MGSNSLVQSFNGSMRNSEHFPSPFLDMASLHTPEHMRTVLELAEFIMSSNGTYRMAQERIASYFLTEVQVGAGPDQEGGDDVKDKWKAHLDEDLGILNVLKSCLMNRQTYGNDFTSLVVPHRRFVQCRRCKRLTTFREFTTHPAFKHAWNSSTFKMGGTCPCEYKGDHDFYDEPDKNPKKLKLRSWSPHDIHIQNCPFTGDKAYLWKIPEDYRRDIIKGELFQLERASQEVLKAIQMRGTFRFAPGVIHHMSEPTLAGIRNRGWGIPGILANFRQVWYVQVLHRYNEAIALDYVIPFRLITPMPRGGSGAGDGQTIDPVLTMNMGNFNSNVQRMLAKRRRDPASWHTLPFPVQYQALGGDATQLAPRDLMDQGMETLLNATGTPIEMYRGTMTLQAAPTGLRLYEATHRHLWHDLHTFMRWLVEQEAEVLGWEPVTASLRSVQYADDMNKQMAILQLMMGQAVSPTTALQSLGLNNKDEVRQKIEDQRYEQEQTAEVQEEMDTAAFGQQMAKGQATMPGQQPAGGAPGQPPPQGGAPQQPGQAPGPVTSSMDSLGGMGSDTKVTPDEMMENADSLANQLLGMPDTQRRSELVALKKKNEFMHSLVTAKIKRKRTQAQTAAGAQVMAQQQGQQ